MNLITARADENIKEMTDLTFPIIKSFCKKWNVDFLVLDKDSKIITDDNHSSHYRIIELYNLLNNYDRILNLDADIVINKNCPNLFDIVPINKIGSIFEDRGSRKEARLQRLKHIQTIFGEIGWSQNSINTGVFLVSSQHKDIFLPVNNQYYTADGSDDLHIGYQIHKLKYEIHELSYKFNHMTMFSEKWNNYANRFDSYIIHYAGKGIFDKNIKNRKDQISKDISLIYG